MAEAPKKNAKVAQGKAVASQDGARTSGKVATSLANALPGASGAAAEAENAAIAVRERELLQEMEQLRAARGTGGP